MARQGLVASYNQARHADPKFRIAQTQTRIAGARYRDARGKLLLQLSVSGQYQYVQQHETLQLQNFESDSRASLNANRYSVNLRQTLFDWSRIESARAAATRHKSVRLKVSAARQKLMVRVAKAYFAVLEARDRLVGAQHKTASIQRQVQRARAQYRAGARNVIDAQEAQSRLDSVKVKAIESEDALDTARQALHRLTGQKPERLQGLQVDEPLPFSARSVAHRPTSAWVHQALRQAPQIQAARAAYRAARQSASAAWGHHLPTLSLVGNIGRQEQLYPTNGLQADETTQTYAIGIQLRMPLFSGGSIDAKVDQARAQAEKARLQMIALQRKLRYRVKNAARRMRLGRRRIHALTRGITSAEKAHAAAKAGHQYGTQTIQDVIDAELTLVNRRTKWKKVWYSYALALLQLRQAAGAANYQALVRINAFLRY